MTINKIMKVVFTWPGSLSTRQKIAGDAHGFF